MYKLFLSFRYFRSRLINIIPVVCMTLGVMALIVILAVMDGFQAQLRATLRGTLSDIIVRVDYPSDFGEWEKVLARMEGVEAWSPHLQSYVLVANVVEEKEKGGEGSGSERKRWLGGRRRTAMEPAAVLGIDHQREAEVSEFASYLKIRPTADPKGWIPTTVDPHPFRVVEVEAQAEIRTPDGEMLYELCEVSGVILGRHLAGMLGVGPPKPWVRDGKLLRREDGTPRYRYDRVNLTTAVRGRDSQGREVFSTQQQTCPVTGLYESGNQDIDQHIAYMDRRVAKRIFDIARDPQEIRIELTDYRRDRDRVKAELQRREVEIIAKTRSDPAMTMADPRARYFVQTWEDRQRYFLNAIENEKGLIAIIAGMAFVVTGFMIFSILSMIVTMKTRDIGILKALGGTTRGVLWIFILNGLIVGVIGAASGLGLGLLFVDNINDIKEFMNNVFGWEPFPQNIYKFKEIPTRVIPAEAAAVTGMALLVALLGAFLPALRAARMDPVESLRYE